MRGIRLYAIVAAAFMAGTFLASPELRAYAANTIGSADIINNTIQSVDIKDAEVKTPDLAPDAVTAVKIKDSEVKAAEIATDAVGAAELQGVTKLLFGQCVLDSAEGTNSISPGAGLIVHCNISGVDNDDSAIATMNKLNACLAATAAVALNNDVIVLLRNPCDHSVTAGTGTRISIIVFDK
ncbi:MAG TPA: hypothetical protein VIB07_05105 [Nitrososphaera sp.]